MNCSHPRCVFCGKLAMIDGICGISGEHRCYDDVCMDLATRYASKKDSILSDFANEKERVLRPLKEKLDMDLFLHGRDSLKYR